MGAVGAGGTKAEIGGGWGWYKGWYGLGGKVSVSALAGLRVIATGLKGDNVVSVSEVVN